MASLKLADGVRLPVDAFVSRLLARLRVSVQSVPLNLPSDISALMARPDPTPTERERIAVAVDDLMARFRGIHRSRRRDLYAPGNNSEAIVPGVTAAESDELYVVLDGEGVFLFPGESDERSGLVVEVSSGDCLRIGRQVRHLITSVDGQPLRTLRYIVDDGTTR